MLAVTFTEEQVTNTRLIGVQFGVVNIINSQFAKLGEDVVIAYPDAGNVKTFRPARWSHTMMYGQQRSLSPFDATLGR